jgi:hypothetical protein
MLTPVSIVVAFNVLTDPTGEFGQSGRYAFNRSPPQAVLARGRAGGNPAFHTRALRETGATRFLVGASRTSFGFDTCGRPDVLKVAGAAWATPEYRQALKLILAGRRDPVGVYFEVGMPTTTPPVVGDPLRAAVSAALSPRTTLDGVRTIAHSLSSRGTAPAYVACIGSARAPDWPAADLLARQATALLDLSSEALKRDERELLRIADLADATCARAGVRHEVVFYALPSSPATALTAAQSDLFDRHARRLARVFADRAAAPEGCRILFVDLANHPPGGPDGPGSWQERRHWNDHTHFSPRLGAYALEALLDAPHPVDADPSGRTAA